MDDLIASLPVMAGTAVIVALIFFLTNRAKSQRLKMIQDLAAANHWDYEVVKGRLESGFRLSAGGWTFESISTSTDRPSESGSATVSHTAVWRYNALIPGDMLVYLGEKPPGSDSEFGKGLVRQAFHLFLGKEGEGMNDVQAGTSSFRQRYLVMARHSIDAENLLTPHLEHLLVNFPGRAPVVRIDGKGIQMKTEGVKIDKPEEILAFIRLGEALMDALRFP